MNARAREREREREQCACCNRYQVKNSQHSAKNSTVRRRQRSDSRAKIGDDGLLEEAFLGGSHEGLGLGRGDGLGQLTKVGLEHAGDREPILDATQIGTLASLERLLQAVDLGERARDGEHTLDRVLLESAYAVVHRQWQAGFQQGDVLAAVQQVERDAKEDAILLAASCVGRCR